MWLSAARTSRASSARRPAVDFFLRRRPLKIDLKTLGAAALKIAVPIATVVVAQKITTGKIDLKGALRDAARKAINDRLAA